MRKRILWQTRSTLVIGAVVGLWMVLGAGQAQATLMGPFLPEDPDNAGTYFNNDTVENMEALYLDKTGKDKELFFINKWEVGPGEDVPVTDGAWLTEYLTDYLTVEEHASGNQYANVGWDFRSFSGDLELGAIAVKDGNANQSGISWVWYYPDGDQEIWNGDFLDAVDTLANGAGAISHISFYGTGDAPAVPEPATMLLLGTGLVGLAGFRKKFKK
jgi:hypothetical protein